MTGSTAATARPVLMYHAVGSPMPRGLEELTVPPALLGEQLAALAGAGWALRPVGEALAAPAGERVVGLSFDDAYTDFVEAALPVLVEAGARATLYAPTDDLGAAPSWLPGGGEGLRLLDAGGLQEAADAGTEVGSHAAAHVPLDVLPPLEVLAGLRRSRSVLQDAVQQPVDSLAYPHGYTSRRLQRAVAAAGFASALAIGHRRHRVGGPDEEARRLAVPRLFVGPQHDAAAVLRLVEEGPSPWLPAVKRLAGPAWRTARRAARAGGRTWT